MSMKSVHAEQASRARRGLALFRERGGEIERLGKLRYLIPGCLRPFYVVDLVAESCECPDFTKRGESCKHLFAAVVHREKVEIRPGRARCDFEFLKMLEEDYGIRQFSLRSAFLGIPTAGRREAVAVCETALKKARDLEEAGELVRRWARECEVGMYQPAIVGGSPLTFGGRTGFEIEGV